MTRSLVFMNETFVHQAVNDGHGFPECLSRSRSFAAFGKLRHFLDVRTCP